MFNFAGVKIIFSESSLEETEERNFPFSKHRSRRIHKKLVKRYGGEFKKVPCIYQMQDTIICHPKFKKELENAAVSRPNYYDPFGLSKNFY